MVNSLDPPQTIIRIGNRLTVRVEYRIGNLYSPTVSNSADVRGAGSGIRTHEGLEPNGSIV